jgi:chaperonin GroEL (HSP60 family)
VFIKGLHPRLITEGFELARNKALEVLDAVKVKREMDRPSLIEVARTSLRTKVHADLADLLTEVCCADLSVCCADLGVSCADLDVFDALWLCVR